MRSDERRCDFNALALFQGETWLFLVYYVNVAEPFQQQREGEVEVFLIPSVNGPGKIGRSIAPRTQQKLF